MFEMRPYAKRNNSLYNPFRDMDEFEKKFFSSPFGFFDTNVLDEFKTDIKDEGDRYELEADLPGFDKKDIHLDINGDMLTVSAERHSEHEEKDKKNNMCVASALTAPTAAALIYRALKPMRLRQNTKTEF